MISGQEFFSYPHVVAIGRRKMVLPPDGPAGKRPKEYEVYVRLLSGSSFAVTPAITRKSAGRAFENLAREMSEQTGCTFITMPDCCVPLEHVARVYVDTQENGFVAIIEDSSGATYEIERGSKSRCDNAVQIVAGTILQYMSNKETE